MFGQRDFQKWKCWVRQSHSLSSSRSALETRISKQAAQWGGVESTSTKIGKWARDGRSNQRRLGWDGVRHGLAAPGARELGFYTPTPISHQVSRAGEGAARSPALLACHACRCSWKKMLVTWSQQKPTKMAGSETAWWSSGWDSALSLQETWAWSLVKKIRSHRAWGKEKKNIFLKEKEKQSSDHPEFYYGALSQGIKSLRVQNNKIRFKNMEFLRKSPCRADPRVLEQEILIRQGLYFIRWQIMEDSMPLLTHLYVRISIVLLVTGEYNQIRVNQKGNLGWLVWHWGLVSLLRLYGGRFP